MANTPIPILATLTPEQLAHATALLDEFVDRSGGPDACWPWTGGTFVRGYGCFYTLGTAKTRRMIKAHRLAYELANDGDCPPTVDHECHDNADCTLAEACPHRRCCNPAHLAAKTVAQNLSRSREGIYRSECRRRHAMTPENTYETPSGGRQCRACAAARARSARQQAKSERAAAKATTLRRPRGMGPYEVAEWLLSSAVEGPGGCLTSSLTTTSGGGYATVRLNGRMIGAHRLIHEVMVGAIPPGMVVDHECHDPQTCPGGMSCPHRACINPEHLIAKAPAANLAPARVSRRHQDECINGHSFTPENTHVDGKGRRHCRACHTERQRAARAAAKGDEWIDPRFRQDGLCRNGHDVAKVGVRPGGKCAECARERQREYKARMKAAATAGPGM